MDLLNILYTLMYQTGILFFLALTIAYFYKGKEFSKLKQRFTHKLLIGVYVGFFISLIYALNISKMLNVLLIILTFSIIYVGLINSLFIFMAIFISYIFYFGYSNLLFLYLFIIVLTYSLLKPIKNINLKYGMVFLLSIFFLNVELFRNQVEIFWIYNLFSIISWLVLFYISIYFHNRGSYFLAIQNKAFRDELTGLKNYFCLVNQSSRLLKEKNSYLSIILINISRLKGINNLYSKDVGNQVLKMIAESIREIVEDFGEVYRLDGDTFCVVAIKEKRNMMEAISDKIRLDIEIKEFIVDNNKIKLSVSIGGFYGEIESKNIDDYIDQATYSLINSKRGRNKVIINNQVLSYKYLI